MDYKMKLAMNITRIKPQKLISVATTGFILVFMTILVMYHLHSVPFFTLSFRLQMDEAPTGLMNEDSTNSQLSGRQSRNQEPERRPMCDDSGPRSVVCEVKGDIRILGKSGSILSVGSKSNESWRIRPYARRGDSVAMQHVREVSLQSSNGFEESPQCAAIHSIPAILFSTGGYVGNLFHEFSDVLIPLFLTSYGYKGEVQFLVTDMKPLWILKHQQTFKALSRYEIIDFDKDDRVHCFKRVIVGLQCHKEFNIDPSRSPAGYSMANFTHFMRSSHSLPREATLRIGEEKPSKKPRLLIISRRWTRSFTNIKEIVSMAEQVGFEVAVAEPGSGMDMAEFARLVNSCDVMVGIHGAGLSNLVFLPVNAVLIQIVPWGRLEGIARYTFGWPATDAKLRYIQYEIGVEESSLVEEYPRDHPFIKDPLSVHRQGWLAVRGAFLKQNVKLDVRRFRAVLLEALKSIQE